MGRNRRMFRIAALESNSGAAGKGSRVEPEDERGGRSTFQSRDQSDRFEQDMSADDFEMVLAEHGLGGRMTEQAILNPLVAAETTGGYRGF